MAARTRSAAEGKVSAYDPIWSEIRKEAQAAMAAEPALGSFIYATVLSHDRLEDAICHRLAQRLDHSDVDAVLINQTFQAVLAEPPGARRDLPRRPRRRVRPRPRLQPLPRPAALLQRFPRPRHAPLRQRAVARGEARLRAVPAEPRLAHLRRGHPSRRPLRAGHHDRPRNRRRRRRDRRRRQQLLLPACRHARRQRQGDAATVIPRSARTC